MSLASAKAYEDLQRHPAWLDILITLTARRKEYCRMLEVEAGTIEEVKLLQGALAEIRFIEALPQWLIENYDKLNEMEDTDE